MFSGTTLISKGHQKDLAEWTVLSAVDLKDTKAI